MTKINYRIKEICKQEKMTLKDLGESIGKSKQYMSGLANGKIRLTYDMAVKISRVFKKTPDEIFLPSKSNNIGFEESS